MARRTASTWRVCGVQRLDARRVFPVARPPRAQQPASISSIAASQSSSRPLHASAGGLQLPHAHVPPQSLLPVEAQPVVQLPTDPLQQAKPSSQSMSQSSSTALHVSAGGVHAPHAQAALHMRVPVEPQLAVHEPLVPDGHVKPLSMTTLQSSSTPLQVSAGGVQAPHVQAAPQTREPVVPQLDVHEDTAPGMQA